MNNEFKVGDLVRWNLADAKEGLPQSVLKTVNPGVITAVVTEVFRSSRRVKWIRVISPRGQEFVRKPEWVEFVAKGNCE